MILEEFDLSKNSIINPSDVCKGKSIKNCPKLAITCFSYVTFQRLVLNLNAVKEENFKLGNANGIFDVYRAKYNGIEFLMYMSIVGAPSCVGFMEELTFMGVEKYIVFGTCGVLDRNIKDLSIIIPNSAIRDDGTSYHYKKYSDEIKVNTKYIDDFKQILEQNKIDYTIGKVWTTDAFYRETEKKLNKRKEQGCIAVDMECSAIAAFAEFRNVEVFHFFYSADSLDINNWDKRSIGNYDKLEEKDKIAYISLLLAEKILKK